MWWEKKIKILLKKHKILWETSKMWWEASKIWRKLPILLRRTLVLGVKAQNLAGNEKEVLQETTFF